MNSPLHLHFIGRARLLASRIKQTLKNHKQERDRTIWIDVTILEEHDARTGIQRVTHSIALELTRNPPPGWVARLIRFDLTTLEFYQARRTTEALLGERIQATRKPIYMRDGDLFLGLDLTPGEIEHKSAPFQKLQNRGVGIAHILYDMLAIRHPEWWGNGMGSVMERWAELISQHSDAVVAISKTSLEDYRLWLQQRSLAAPERLEWFHLGADLANSNPTKGMPEDASRSLSILSNMPSLLMVGTLEPRKGHAQAILAFEELWATGLDIALVIVGKYGWGVDELAETIRNHRENGNRLFWLEGISDEYLEAIYSNCTGLLAASEGEGFGLPLIEASRNGLPILARNLGVFQEVAGDQATYFSGKNPSDLATAIIGWIAEMGQHEKRPDFPWQTWKESCDQLVAALGLPPRKT